MSIYYSPELVKTLMEERVRDARKASSIIHCCEELRAEVPDRITAAVRNLFRRQSHAACAC